MKANNRSHFVQVLLRKDFKSFLMFAYAQVNGGKKPSANWHIDVMVDRVGGIAEGRHSRLIVNAPPRSLKSFTCSAALPAFMLGRDPTKQILLVAGNPLLGGELMERLERLMTSPQYRALFPHVLCDRKPSCLRLRSGGSIRLAYVGQQISGIGADLVIVDDPLSPNLARDAARRQSVNDWFEGDVLTRLNDKRASSVLVVMQRVHPEDLSGRIRGQHGDFQTLSLSAVAISDEKWTLSDGRVFTRPKHTALDPNRESTADLRARLKELGSFQFNGQYLQGSYHPFVEREFVSGFFWEEPKPNHPPWQSLSCGLFKIPYPLMYKHHVFGDPYDGPIMGPWRPEWTPERQEYFMEYQRLLSGQANEDQWKDFYMKYPQREHYNGYIIVPMGY